MSISDDILLFLQSSPSSYKKIQNAWRADLQKEVSGTTLYTSLHRLKKKGFIAKHDEQWNITQTGEGYISKKMRLFHHTIEQKEKILVLFDIPEKERFKRDWLRKQLSLYNYEKVQASVWLGPGPLPQEFINFLKQHDIYKYIIFFRTQGNIEL